MLRKLAAVSRQRLLSLTLILAGVALLAYVATQYGTMWLEQRRLAQAFEEQQRQPPQAQTVASQPSASPVSDYLTRLTIPKINLQAMVVEGTSRKQLLVGLGHIKQTAAPGEVGNSVITAHRDTFFRHIHELDKGDELVVERGGQIYRYEVTGKKIVEPQDLSVLRQGNDKRLTLITCYPTYYIGPAPERLVVFSKLKEDQAAKTALAGSGGGN